MKIKPEHYEQLKKLILAAVEKLGKDKILLHQETLKKSDQVKNPKRRFHWDLLYCSHVDKVKRGLLIKEIYEYANDWHIETALFKIGKELDLWEN